ncbi:MAG: hypothetical protein E5X35_07295 [Mesorhizobium sp.]|uniref:hypothetical protein n=1 Tax=Mesorhizobium TaxID=68287 RepID=UPI00121E6F55|nr:MULTISPECIES: hypothetical protein [Mesorhizobium]MCF6120832.1 hypothetical protein [Mesorhizobium muleiense]TIR34513.1 MAG: hypothetical protein E5X35_07295 [Mesorhizobium sp.]
MADRPILFSGPMVRALLASTKTQTRRVIGPDFRKVDWTDPDTNCQTCKGNAYWGKTMSSWTRCPACVRPRTDRFAVGDRLYVREHWRTESHAYDDLAPSDMDADYPVIYDADADWSLNKSVGRFRQGMHMPRWASRLTLIVRAVRVQRLQDIGEEDAIAEGCAPLGSEFLIPGQYLYSDPSKPRTAISATSAYESLWNQINEARGYGWDANPWVVAVAFTVEHRNIDQVPA